MDLDAEHRTLVRRRFECCVSRRGTIEAVSPLDQDLPHVLCPLRNSEEANMGRGLLLWLLGVPIPVIILLWLFFGR